MNINVVGTSGVGKSTLARRLAQILSVPYIEMDRLYWRAEWQGVPDEVFFARVVAATETPGWVLDGNYNRSRPVNGAMSIWWCGWIMVSPELCARPSVGPSPGQAAVRSCGREPATESFRRAFLSRDSIIWWTLKTWKNNRQRYQSDMTDPAYRHIRFVRLRHPRQTEDFIRQLQRQVAPR
jgi:energy-coupling factor transporter ATP-binding protein EcfA2